MKVLAQNEKNFSAVVAKFGSVSAAVAAAEAVAMRLLVEEQDTSEDWATSYIAKAKMLPHMGDCNQARFWMRGPVTCDACVYDELMGKAWAKVFEEV